MVSRNMIWIGILSMFLFMGVLLVKNAFFNCIQKGGKKSFYQLSKKLMVDLKDETSDEVFQSVGIHFSIKKYIAIQTVVVGGVGVAALFTFLSGELGQALPLSMVSVFLYLLSYPYDIKGKKSPFRWGIEKFRGNYLEKKDNELIAVITQFKNLIVTQADEAWGSDFILQNLMRFTKLTKPAFVHTLSMIRLSRKDEASQVFSEKIGTKLGQDFAEIIRKLDDLKPKEFQEQLELFLAEVKEEKRTRKAKKQEFAARIMFLLASIEMFLIFVDFMYIVFINTMSYMKF